MRTNRVISLDRCRGLGGIDDGDGGLGSDVLGYRGYRDRRGEIGAQKEPRFE
jgi:hypothetical protein